MDMEKYYRNNDRRISPFVGANSNLSHGNCYTEVIETRNQHFHQGNRRQCDFAPCNVIELQPNAFPVNAQLPDGFSSVMFTNVSSSEISLTCPNFGGYPSNSIIGNHYHAHPASISNNDGLSSLYNQLPLSDLEKMESISELLVSLNTTLDHLREYLEYCLEALENDQLVQEEMERLRIICSLLQKDKKFYPKLDVSEGRSNKKCDSCDIPKDILSQNHEDTNSELRENLVQTCLPSGNGRTTPLATVSNCHQYQTPVGRILNVDQDSGFASGCSNANRTSTNCLDTTPHTNVHKCQDLAYRLVNSVRSSEDNTKTNYFKARTAGLPYTNRATLLTCQRFTQHGETFPPRRKYSQNCLSDNGIAQIGNGQFRRS